MTTKSTRAGVFLDRDGVLNAPIVRDGLPYSPRALEEFALVPQVRETCRRLAETGAALVVVTNQPDIARGKLDRAVLDTMDAHLVQEVGVDAVYTCPHDDDDRCACRKPLPGLLQQAADDLMLDLNASIMVGDRWRDIAAGRAAGCSTVWIRHGYLEREPTDPDHTASSLHEAVPWIVHHLDKENP